MPATKSQHTEISYTSENWVKEKNWSQAKVSAGASEEN